MPLQFRLYYDDNGNVLFYTCEKPEGNYIVIDKDIYAEGRPDHKIIDGKITKPKLFSGTIKLVQSAEGVSCNIDDISIVTDEGQTQKWKLKINE